jgi:hypothetical protein
MARSFKMLANHARSFKNAYNISWLTSKCLQTIACHFKMFSNNARSLKMLEKTSVNLSKWLCH